MSTQYKIIIGDTTTPQVRVPKTGDQTYLAPVTLNDSTGNEVAFDIQYTTNKSSSGDDTGLVVNQTDTASPGTSLLADFQVGSSSVFSVDNVGEAKVAQGLTLTDVAYRFEVLSSTKLVRAALSRGMIFRISTDTLNEVTWDFLASSATAEMVATSGVQKYMSLTPNINQSSTAGYTGFFLNVLETGTGSGSNLLADFQVGSTSQWLADNSGSTSQLGNVALLSDAGVVSFGASTDIIIARDAAGILAQRNTTNPQESRVYADYTSSSDYQRNSTKTSRTVTTVPSAASFTLSGFIPDGAFLIGITSRVDTTCTTATGYTVGDGSDVDLWGVGSGVAQGDITQSADFTAAGAVGFFSSAQDVVVTSTGGNFDGTGVITVCAHYLITEAD